MNIQLQNLKIKGEFFVFLFYFYLVASDRFEKYFQKILSPPSPLKKSTSPLLLTPPPLLKIQKVQVPPFWPTLKIFQPPPFCRNGGGRTLWNLKLEEENTVLAKSSIMDVWYVWLVSNVTLTFCYCWGPSLSGEYAKFSENYYFPYVCVSRDKKY